MSSCLYRYTGVLLVIISHACLVLYTVDIVLFCLLCSEVLYLGNDKKTYFRSFIVTVLYCIFYYQSSQLMTIYPYEDTKELGMRRYRDI